MDRMKSSGTFTMDGGAHSFDIGYIPDYVRVLINLEEGDNEVLFEWWRALADKAGSGQYGVSVGAAGAVTVPTTAITGIIPYTEGDDLGVLIEHPGSGKKVIASVADWLIATSYASGARSSTAIGTIIRPPTHIDRVFELTTATGSGTSEPSGGWDVQPGQTVTDGGSNVWTCRKEEVYKAGGQGFVIGTDMSTDSDECVFMAEQHTRYENFGDLDGKEPVRFESNQR